MAKSLMQFQIPDFVLGEWLPMKREKGFTEKNS
jgi:hypothetical protein